MLISNMSARISCFHRLTKFHNNVCCLVAGSRSYVYRTSYRPPGTEPGTYHYFKKRMPPHGHMPFSARIERLKEKEVQHADLLKPVDIGLPQLREDRLSRLRKRDSETEEKARKNELIIPLEEVEEIWKIESSEKAVTTLSHHFNIFKDLFHEPHFFYPRIALDLFYIDQNSDSKNQDEIDVLPVYYGNCIPATDAASSPYLSFSTPLSLPRNSLWTIVMTCPDEHLQEQKKEYIHWMVSNIPTNADGKSDLPSGDVICNFLPPIPPRGTGYHRYVFILYHQETRIDLSSEIRGEKSSLDERTFSTFDFYREHQENLTPAGLAFHQTEWDSSVKERYHHLLDMKEPVFEFEWPREHRKKQVKFPEGESFDKYLDKYRDVHDINEEVLKEKLKLVHPFKDYPERLKYPMSIPFPKSMPTWLREREKDKRLRQGMWKDLP